MASQFPQGERLRIIEPDHVPEFFVTDLADFEIRMGLIRLAFSCERHLASGVAYAPFSGTASIVRVRLVMPLDREREMNREITNRIIEHQHKRPVS